MDKKRLSTLICSLYKLPVCSGSTLLWFVFLMLFLAFILFWRSAMYLSEPLQNILQLYVEAINSYSMFCKSQDGDSVLDQ